MSPARIRLPRLALRTFALGVPVLLAAACDRGQGGDSAGGASASAAASAPANPDPEKNTYADSLGVDLSKFTKLPSGVLYQDVVAGTGAEAKFNTRVSVHYTGWLPDGKKFDSSRNGGTPFELVIGAHEVIRGWEEGLPGMKVGGRRKIIIPPALGYGADGAPPDIPPNAVLVFDLELMDVKAP